MTDRIFAFSLIVVSTLYGAIALRLDVPFVYDPLGPKPVPLILAALLLISAVIIFVIPTSHASPTRSNLRRFIYLTAILIFYLATWNLLGFLLSTTVSGYLVARQFHSTWMQGLMTALVISVVCYGLFTFILEIPLPLGLIYIYTGL